MYSFFNFTGYKTYNERLSAKKYLIERHGFDNDAAESIIEFINNELSFNGYNNIQQLLDAFAKTYAMMPDMNLFEHAVKTIGYESKYNGCTRIISRSEFEFIQHALTLNPDFYKGLDDYNEFDKINMNILSITLKDLIDEDELYSRGWRFIYSLREIMKFKVSAYGLTRGKLINTIMKLYDMNEISLMMFLGDVMSRIDNDGLVVDRECFHWKWLMDNKDYPIEFIEQTMLGGVRYNYIEIMSNATNTILHKAHTRNTTAFKFIMNTFKIKEDKYDYDKKISQFALTGNVSDKFINEHMDAAQTFEKNIMKMNELPINIYGWNIRSIFPFAPETIIKNNGIIDFMNDMLSRNSRRYCAWIWYRMIMAKTCYNHAVKIIPFTKSKYDEKQEWIHYVDTGIIPDSWYGNPTPSALRAFLEMSENNPSEPLDVIMKTICRDADVITRYVLNDFLNW